ncbi:MAG: TRAM domain-containing protein, partial [Planctomycetota bacterium]
QYRVGDYLEMIDQVNDALTRHDDGGDLPPAITTDVICGFPGETERDFDRTVAVARRVGYLHMHVFPYSPKRGTAAARWSNAFLPPEVAKTRVRRLLDLESAVDDGLGIVYRRLLLGRTVRVILEQRDRQDPSCMVGRCDHYASVTVRTDRPRGTVVQATITEVTSHECRGELQHASLPLPVIA